ncbi:hypothetical protein TWF506_001261 [Arthrobotrys conoides]|uniref:Uncharacterized protein n=1 Tax=Arthrobotrys conoides TaxID=74498 RepID=A0AAN8S1N5_9PEZI
MKYSCPSLEPVDEIIPSAEELETIDKLVEDRTEFVPATPPAVSASSAPPPVRPQDVPVLPATPLLDYATVGKAKSPMVKAATPVTPKVQPVVSEPKSKKKKDDKPQTLPTMAAVAKAPPPPPTPSKTTSKEPAGKKAKPPTLPPLAAVVAAATAEHSPTSARSPAAASPKILKLAAINQSDAGPPSAASSVPPTPLLATAAPTSRARTMRIVSSTPPVESKPKFEGKDKENKLQDGPAIANTATRQVTRPATPASELISDTASTTSSKRGSISSPMVRSDSIASSTLAIAGKVKSKSALKKERQALARKEEKEREKEREREKEKDNAPIPSPTVEDHAPVVARARKKEKKSKAAAAGKTVKTTALPASPGILTPTGISPAAANAAAIEIEHRDDRSSRAGSVSVAAPSEVHHEQASADSGNNDAESEPNKPDLFSTINANDIITALNESREIDFMDLELLKPVVGLQHRFEINSAEISEFAKRLSMVAASAGDVGDHQISVEITANPAAIASAGSNPQSKGAAATTRLIVTPGGVMLKGLSAEQEAKFIRLEERASKTPTPFKSSDLAKATFPVAKKELATTLAETLASKAAGLADLSLEDTLAYLNQLNQFLEFSPETAAAAAAAASQLAQAHTQFTAGRFQPAPIQQGPIPSSSKGLPNPVQSGSKKPGKTPPSTAVGPPPAPINPASVASAAVAAAAGSLEQMLMVGFQSAFNSKPMTESSMTAEEAEKLLVMSRKETEAYEKKLNNLMKRNKRLIFGALGLQV